MNPLALYDIAQTALLCICDAMDSFVGEEGVPDGYGCPCLQHVSAGEPSVDCCVESDCFGGMLATWIENVFPSDSFPSQTATFDPCKAQVWVATLVVTVARCAPGMDSNGNPASIEDLSAAGAVMAIDQAAVLQGLSCCLVADAPTGKRRRRVLIGESRPFTQEGGCVGFEVRAAVEVSSLCGCPEGS